MSLAADGRSTDDRAHRRTTAAAYDAYHRSVDAGRFGRYLHFMNYGYRDAGTPGRRTFEPPPSAPGRDEARLVAEVIADEDLDGRRVLDVGCGRGGALGLVASAFQPATATGIDLSIGGLPRAAEWLRGAARFAVGDACHLPVASDAVDVVLCVESSLHYPDIEAFYREARRVVGRGGRLLYADFFLAGAVDAYDEALGRAGFELGATRDVTSNVLASRRARAERERLAFESARDAEDVRRFVGTEGTGFERALADGTYCYRILQAKGSTAAQPADHRDPRLVRAVQVAAEITSSFDPVGHPGS